MKIFVHAAGVIGLLLAGSMHAQALWPPTRAGMQVDEVQKLFPTAHVPETPGALPGNRAEELLEIDETVIADHHFRVRFFFDEGLLVHVDLFETAEIPLKEFEQFRDRLRAKYGLEYSATSSETLRLEWHVIKSIIRLQWTPVSRGVATLSLSYDAAVPKETDRL
jgi:hypothetical protein